MGRGCLSCGAERLETLWSSFVRAETLEHCLACLAIQRRKGPEAMMEITGATVLRAAERLAAAHAAELAAGVEELGADPSLFVLLRTLPVFERAAKAFEDTATLIRPAEYPLHLPIPTEVRQAAVRLREAVQRGATRQELEALVQELRHAGEEYPQARRDRTPAPLERMEPTAPSQVEGPAQTYRSVVGAGIKLLAVGVERCRLLVEMGPGQPRFGMLTPHVGRYLAPLDLLAPG